jgi:hypothetical protein
MFVILHSYIKIPATLRDRAIKRSRESNNAIVDSYFPILRYCNMMRQALQWFDPASNKFAKMEGCIPEAMWCQKVPHTTHPWDNLIALGANILHKIIAESIFTLNFISINSNTYNCIESISVSMSSSV